MAKDPTSATTAAAATVEHIQYNEELTRQTFWQPKVHGFEEYMKYLAECAMRSEIPDMPQAMLREVRYANGGDLNPGIGGVRRTSDLEREFRFTAQASTTVRLWKQNRIVYDIDPTMWKELGDSDLDSIVPAGILDRLPHPDPYIQFPEPLRIDHGGDIIQVVVGVFLTGRFRWAPPPGTQIRDDRQSPPRAMCSTASPVRDQLGLTFCGFAYTRDGKPYMYNSGLQDMMWTQTSISSATDTSVMDIWRDAASRFHGYQDRDFQEDPRIDLNMMIRRAISLIIYLCAENAELRPLPHQATTPTRAPSNGKRPLKPAKVIGVGYRIGAAIRAYYERRKNDPGPGTGRTVVPHVRRAHFHLFPSGPGRTERTLKWLSPIPVNMNGEAAQPTVIPIRK